MNLTEKDKNALKLGGAFMLVFLLIAIFGLYMRFHKPNVKDKFTPEQKAVLAELDRARADLRSAQTQLEQTKREINDLIHSFKGAAVAKGFDPNVGVSWLPMDGNPVNCGDKHALWGFRADGTVTWKCP